jgi:urocanate hydratase
MRVILAVSILGLSAACSSQGGDSSDARQAESVTIACAVSGASQLSEVCRVERINAADGVRLLVRHPDGGFRRFRLTGDAEVLAVADGAEQASRAVTTVADIDIAVGKDRYRFPASIAGEQ